MAAIHIIGFFIKKAAIVCIFFMAQVALSQKQKLGLSVFVPDYTNLQYAGSIGAASFAIGYDLGKQQKTHLEFFYGYTPKYDNDSRMSSITVKGLRTFTDTLRISDKYRLTWSPFTAGIGLSYIADRRFFGFDSKLPYPSGYYWHKTGLRTIAFFQTALICHINKNKTKNISYYLEANIQDVYVTLMIADRQFTVFNMIRLGMGVKFTF